MAEPTEIPIPDTIEDIVAQFVKLRDRIKEADDAHKARLKAAKDHLEKLNGVLLDKLQAIGGDSVKTPAGTVYRTTRKSASIADGEAFRTYVIENEGFDLVDWRANALAVADFIESQGAPPPGVNYSLAHTVGVRRA